MIYLDTSQVIASTFFDTCTVLRQGEFENENGKTVFKEKTIYNDLKCSLERNIYKNTSENNGATLISYNTTVFLKSDLNIKVNDVFVINGRRYVAGESFVFEKSHQEVPVVREEYYKEKNNEN